MKGKNRLRLLSGLLAALFIAGCSAKSPPAPEEAPATAPDLPAAAPDRQPKDPVELLKQARAKAAGGDKTAAAKLFADAAYELRLLRKYEQAIAAFGEAIALWRALGDAANEASGLNIRGNYYSWLWRLEEAEKDYRRALELALHSGDKPTQAFAIFNIGLVRQWSGDLKGAHSEFEASLAVLEGTSGLESNIVDTLRFLARLHAIQDQLPEARKILSRARSLQEEKDLRPELVLSDLAWLDILEDRSDRALGLLEQAIAGRSHLTPQNEVDLLNRMGIALSNLKRFAEARAFLREAVEISRREDWRGADLGILISLCKLSIEVPEPDPAVGYKECEEIAASLALADTNRQASGYRWLAEHEHRRGRLPEALAAGSRSIDLLDSLRLRIAGRKSRARFLDDRSAAFRRQAAFEMEAHRAGPGLGHDLAALAISERLRARSLLELWAEGGVDLLQSADPQLLGLLERRLAELPELEEKRNLPGSEAGMAAAMAELDQLHEKLRLSSPDYRRVAQPPRLEMEVLKRKLDDETALVEILLGEPASHLWVIEKERSRSFELPSGARLEAAAKDYLRRLADPSASAERATFWHSGRSLTALLWGDEEERLAEMPRRIVFVGDGQLQQFPLAALPRLASSPQKPRYLLDDFEIVLLPALSMLDPQYLPARSSPPSRPAILLADPLYRLDSGSAIRLRPIETGELATLLPKQRPPFGLGRLPYADLEASRIRERFGARGLVVAAGAQATKRLAISPAIGDFGIVHLTSHGWQDPLQYELSALILSEVDEEGKAVDGKLRLQDLYTLRLRAHLVVASACQTGVGGDFRLEGVTGLAQGFFHAGARRALVSQWPVESESTAHLMDHFYLQLLAGKPPGTALRAASLHLRQVAQAEGKTWDSPFYWAPFVLIGDWSAFELPG